MANSLFNKQNANGYNTAIFPTWCPGCGDFGIWAGIKQALVKLKLEPHQILAAYGIGCSGNMSSFVNAYGFHSLHGRAITNAIGAKLAFHTMPIIVVGGDGDLLGEGLSHFIHAARGNHDITVILHNNLVYGLTTGQASPSASMGFKSKSTPSGVLEEPINPAVLAIAHQAGFVARGFAGDISQVGELVALGIKHPGFSLVEILQPCVTFNQINTYDWFRRRIKKVDQTETDVIDGIKTAIWQENQINIGVLYQNDRPAFHQLLPQLKAGTLRETTGIKRNITNLLSKFR